MNWTASLLRNQLKKQQLAYESRLNLLTNTSPDAQNYLFLEQKLKELEANLKLCEQNLTDLKKQAENKEALYSLHIKDQENKISQLEKQKKASKDFIFNLRKEIRENQLYYQQELRKVREDYQPKITEQVRKLKANLVKLRSKIEAN